MSKICAKFSFLKLCSRRRKRGSGRRGNLMDPGSKRERKQHIYIMETGYVLALSLNVRLLVDTRATTLSCHAPTPVRTSLLTLWPCSLSPHCCGNGAKITWLPCRAGHELAQRMNACLYFSPTIAKPGVNPHSHMTTNRKWDINPKHNNSMASPKFMPTGSHSSLYGDSILSTCAWYEEGAAVSLIPSTVRLWPCCLHMFPLSVTVTKRKGPL